MDKHAKGLSQMIERFKFLFSKHPFLYWKETGGGMKIESYNIFSDKVTIRHSLRGYVTGHRQYKRQEYMLKISDMKWKELK